MPGLRDLRCWAKQTLSDRELGLHLATEVGIVTFELGCITERTRPFRIDRNQARIKAPSRAEVDKTSSARDYARQVWLEPAAIKPAVQALKLATVRVLPAEIPG